MALFEGYPVYIELDDENRIFEIITIVPTDDSERVMNYDYDVDWCDDHGHYHAHQTGRGSAPLSVMHRVNEDGNNIPTYYWSMFSVELQPGADPAYCIRLSAADLLPIFPPDEAMQREFLDLYEIPEAKDMEPAFVPELIAYWEKMGYVEEGQVVYCAICHKNYDYEENWSCNHVRWCQICNQFSAPGDECPHRTADKRHYLKPEETE